MREYDVNFHCIIVRFRVVRNRPDVWKKNYPQIILVAIDRQTYLESHIKIPIIPTCEKYFVVPLILRLLPFTAIQKYGVG